MKNMANVYFFLFLDMKKEVKELKYIDQQMVTMYSIDIVTFTLGLSVLTQRDVHDVFL